MFDRKAHAFAFGAVIVTSTMGGALGVASGCTVLTNDALPDDAGVFAGGDAVADNAAKGARCATCLVAACAGPEALCFTSATCVGVVECAAPATCDTACKTACACNEIADGGASPARLHHAYTACSDARLNACATECAAEHRAPSTFPGCAAPDDAGVDAGVGAGEDAGVDVGEVDDDPCSTCAATSCASAAKSCGSDTECEAFLACSSACATGSCVEDCARVHPTGKVAATELATCTATNCQNDCGL